MTKLLIVAVLCLIVFSISGLPPIPTLNAQDSGSGLANSPWPMFGHDPQHTGRSPYSGPTAPELKWTYTTGGSGDSSPAIGADGTIYVGFYAINPDGSLRWSFTTGGSGDSSPAIGADGTIYVGSYDNKLYAINPDSSLKWAYSTGAGISSSPAIGADGTIYVGSDDKKLYAINANGSLKWSYTTGGSIFSSPAIGADGTVYVGSRDCGLYAISTNGSLKWSYTTRGAIHTAPVVDANGTVYIGSIYPDNQLYAINPDGSFKWAYETGFDIQTSSPAIGTDGTIYVGSFNGNFYAISPLGSLKWSYDVGQYISSSPVIGADGTIYVVGSYELGSKLCAINPNGSLTWDYDTGDYIAISSPAIGADGTIYLGSQHNKIYAINDLPLGVTTNDANNVGTTSATLNGNLISLDGASTASVSFEYGLSTAYGNTTSTQSIAATGLFNTQLRGLTPGTTYHFRAKAIAGTTVYGEDKTFSTQGPPLAQVTSALDSASSAVSQEKSKGFNVTAAENLLTQAEQVFENEDYQAAYELASKAKSLALDIDQDGVPNEQDFAPTIRNIYIYAGASAFAFVLIVSTSSVMTLRWRRKRAEKERREEQRRIEEERKRAETERIEREKAEIIGMIEEALINDRDGKS